MRFLFSQETRDITRNPGLPKYSLLTGVAYRKKVGYGLTAIPNALLVKIVFSPQF
jgi:hypothetical protein